MIQLQIVVMLVLCWSQAGTSLHSTELDFSVIPDPGVRNITQELHHFCPHVDLCRQNMTGEMIIYSRFEPPCCEACSCCEEEAPHYGDSCCPDVLDSLLTPEVVKETLARETDCVHAQYRRFIPEVYNGKSYTMTVNCPPTYTNSTIRQKCRTDYAEINFALDKFSYFFPVSVNRSGDLVTYKNKHCAICSDVQEEDLLQWRIALSCITHAVLIESLVEGQKIISENKQCNLFFIEPAAAMSKLEKCTAVIDRCNVTGLWQQYDPGLEAACLSYTVRYKEDFKNIHCYFCNGYTEDSVTRLCRIDVHGSVSSFIALLDFNDLEKQEPRKEDHSCSEYEIYDPLQKLCLRPQCSPMMKLNENRSACVPKYLQANRMMFESVFALVPRENMTGMSIGFHEIGNVIYRNIKASPLPQNFGADVCNVEALIKVNKTVDQMTRSGFTLRSMDVLYIGVRVTMSTWNLLNFQSTIEDLLQLLNSDSVFPLMDLVNYEIPSYLFDKATAKVYDGTSAGASLSQDNGNSNQSFETTAIPRGHAGTNPIPQRLQGRIIMEDERDGLAILPLPYTAASPYSCGTSRMPIGPLQFCPKIKLTGDYFTVKRLNHTVVISDLDLEINVSQVILNLEEKEIALCIDTYMTALSKYQEDRIYGADGHGFSTEVILSIILSCLSLTCLAITQVTYVVFKNLRTLAGKNNMALVTWLFMTQFLFLIVSQVEINTPWLCTAFGIMLHFSLLSACFWMNVCTFHMTRVFSTIETTSVTRQSNSSAFPKYVRFATLLPILFVVVNLVVSLAGSGMSEIGYGGQICYITRKEMIGYTVAIPLGFVVISDLLMFLVVIYKVRRMPVIHKNKSREKKNIVMFAKLSTLTGLTWIFGFIYQWSSVKTFAYLFIIFNASQGVFIMLAFIVNRHVITIVRGKANSRATQSVKM